MQLLNIYKISVTFDVFNLDKSNEVNDLQPLNINDIFVTFNVFNLDKSNEVKELQS